VRTLLIFVVCVTAPLLATPALACNNATQINGATTVDEYGKSGSKAYNVDGHSNLGGRVGITGTLCLEVNGESSVGLEGYGQDVTLDRLDGRSTVDLRRFKAMGSVKAGQINGASTFNILLDKNASLEIAKVDGASKVGFQFTKECEEDPTCIPTVHCGEVNGGSQCSKGWK